MLLIAATPVRSPFPSGFLCCVQVDTNAAGSGGTQYTLLATLEVLGKLLPTLLAGTIVDHFGYCVLFTGALGCTVLCQAVFVPLRRVAGVGCSLHAPVALGYVKHPGGGTAPVGAPHRHSLEMKTK